MAAHTLDANSTCTTCGLRYSGRSSLWWLASCPGVRWYDWTAIPAELGTRTTLAREGLRPADLSQPAGYYVAWQRKAVVLLYDRRSAIPKRQPRSDRERAARVAAAQRLRALRTCTKCGTVVRSMRHLTLVGDRDVVTAGVGGDGNAATTVASATLPPAATPPAQQRLCEQCFQGWQWEQELRWLYRTARAILRDGGAALDLGGERMRAGPPLRILDTETTGLDDTDEPIELAIVDGTSGAVLLDTRLRPSVPISPDAQAVHGIAEEDLRDAPTLAEVWPQVRKALRGSLVMAYNADFDRGMLRQAAERYGLKWPACKWWCLMEACTVFDGPDEERRRWVGLEAMCWELDVASGGHSARGDALAALDVLRALAARAEE